MEFNGSKDREKTEIMSMQGLKLESCLDLQQAETENISYFRFPVMIKSRSCISKNLPILLSKYAPFFSKERKLILIQHLSLRWSNADIGGMWMFKIGPLSNNENILEPSLTSNSSKKEKKKICKNLGIIKNNIISFFLGLDPYSARSCDLGQLTCHGSATCEDHSNGFCCKCINGWYGDGSTCLPKVL